MRRILVIGTVLLAVAAALYFVFRPISPAEQARRRGENSPPIAVIGAPSTLRDVPVYLDGLGTVQAFNQVQIRPQVDGPLLEVRFREGQDVARGDVLARIDPRPFQATLDGALAKKQQDEANLANARLDAGRYAKLAATAYSSAQQSDTARAQVSQLEAQVRGDQAQIDTARTQLSYTTILAPIDGRTGIRQVDAGNIARASDVTPITVITQLKPISVVFTLPQQSLPAVASAIQGGMPEVLALRADSGGRGGILERGQLSVLDNQVDPATGTIKLKAVFPNSTLLLWPGGFVNVRMLVQTLPQVVTVPPAAVQRGPRGAFVYVVADGKAERRVIRVGHEDDQASVIAEGLKPGEQVVVDGAQRLTDGARVTIAAPDGTAPVPERGGPGSRRNRGTAS